jgi:hypothetical protein
MRIVATKEFFRRARKAGLTSADLSGAIDRAEKGLIDAKIGSGLIKQRIARKNEGKSRGLRSVIFYRKGDRAVFLHLFEKSAQANLSETEEAGYRELAKFVANLTDRAIADLVQKRKWKEIDYEPPQEKVSKRRASIAPPGG